MLSDLAVTTTIAALVRAVSRSVVPTAAAGECTHIDRDSRPRGVGLVNRPASAVSRAGDFWNQP